MSEQPVLLLRGPQRWFTPAEANALLPQLIVLVDALIDGLERADEVSRLLEQADDVQDLWAVSQDLSELQEANRESFEQLEAHGVELKGLSPALLAFPALRHGQHVLLSWGEGETEVAYWHPIHTGLRGRQPIEPDSAGAWEYWS